MKDEMKEDVKEVKKQEKQEEKKEDFSENKKDEKAKKKEKRILDRKRKNTGIVFSKKNDKTIKVEVEKWYKHILYKKSIKRTKKILVHDMKNEANVGDKVLIVESRPLSKLKRWRLLKIVQKAK